MTKPFQLIPVTAKILAAVAFLGSAGLASWLFGGTRFGLAGTLMVAFGGAILVAFILLAGYVYGDAARRGMPAGIWTALALLIPNGVGFVLYFLMRKPIVHPCPICGGGVADGFAFCPSCGASQAAPAVPQ